MFLVGTCVPGFAFKFSQAVEVSVSTKGHLARWPGRCLSNGSVWRQTRPLSGGPCKCLDTLWSRPPRTMCHLFSGELMLRACLRQKGRGLLEVVQWAAFHLLTCPSSSPGEAILSTALFTRSGELEIHMVYNLAINHVLKSFSP